MLSGHLLQEAMPRGYSIRAGKDNISMTSDAYVPDAPSLGQAIEHQPVHASQADHCHQRAASRHLKAAHSLRTPQPRCATAWQESHLAAESSRGLLPATLPGAVGAVDVVEASHAALDAEVGVVVLAQLLSDQLLQAIGILRL